jgi:geranylgeranyl diphosphate synthase type II
MPQLNLAAYLESKTRIVNKALDRFLPHSHQPPSIIHKAMRYSVNAGGKRLRPVLVIAGAEICGGKAETVLPTACALELIHTYSLVHDDLPAMDNDDLRRGRPTSHKVFGEDMAILTGDALLTLAFQLMALNSKKKVSTDSLLDVIGLVSLHAGTNGMVGGQVADIKADQGQWKRSKALFKSPKKWLQFIHLNKTAALIRASLVAGARLSTNNNRKIRLLDNYGMHIGLAFQITDDILDILGDKKKLGKKGSDQKNQKLTFPAHSFVLIFSKWSCGTF